MRIPFEHRIEMAACLTIGALDATSDEHAYRMRSANISLADNCKMRLFLN